MLAPSPQSIPFQRRYGAPPASPDCTSPIQSDGHLRSEE
jgi:hypothetical protein